MHKKYSNTIAKSTNSINEIFVQIKEFKVLRAQLNVTNDG